MADKDKKQYWLVIRQGDGKPTKVKTTDPAGELGELARDHKPSDSDKDKDISIEIYDGNVSGDNIDNNQAGTPLVKGTGNTVASAVKDAGGVGKGQEERLNDALEQADPEFKPSEDKDKDKDKRYTFTIEINGNTYEGQGDSPEKAFEDARKAAAKTEGEDALRSKETKVTLTDNEEDESITGEGNNLAEAVLDTKEIADEDKEHPLRTQINQVFQAESKRCYRYVITVNGKDYIGIVYDFNDLPAAQAAAQKKLKQDPDNHAASNIIDQDEDVEVKIIDGKGQAMGGKGASERLALENLKNQNKDVLSRSQNKTLGRMVDKANGNSRGLAKAAWTAAKFGMPFVQGLILGMAAKAAAGIGVAVFGLAGWPVLAVAIVTSLLLAPLIKAGVDLGLPRLMSLFNGKAVAINKQAIKQNMTPKNRLEGLGIMIASIAGYGLSGAVNALAEHSPLSGGPSGGETAGIDQIYAPEGQVDGQVLSDNGVVETRGAESVDIFDTARLENGDTLVWDGETGQYEVRGPDGEVKGLLDVNRVEFDRQTGEVTVLPAETPAGGPTGGMTNNQTPGANGPQFA